MSGGSRDPVLRIAGGQAAASPRPSPPGSATSNRELKQPPPRQDNDNVNKKKLLFSAKSQLCTCINLFCTFLWRLLHDYDVKPPHATFFGDVDIRWSIFLSLFEPGHKVLKNSTPRKFAYIWHIEQVQIDALKFERRQIHLFSDVFTAVVAIVDTCLSSLYHWIDLKNEHDLWTKGL